MTSIIEVESEIITLRDQQVILDSDVAELYGVETKRINIRIYQSGQNNLADCEKGPCEVR